MGRQAGWLTRAKAQGRPDSIPTLLRGAALCSRIVCAKHRGGAAGCGTRTHARPRVFAPPLCSFTQPNF